jgi:hypothetical protein
VPVSPAGSLLAPSYGPEALDALHGKWPPVEQNAAYPLPVHRQPEKLLAASFRLGDSDELKPRCCHAAPSPRAILLASPSSRVSIDLPHCGHVHTAAATMRVAWNTLQFQQCKREFPGQEASLADFYLIDVTSRNSGT